MEEPIEADKQEEKVGFLKGLWEIVKVVAIAFALVFLIRHFLIQPFFVSGKSMEPNFYEKEYLLIDEISYRLRVPERGAPFSLEREGSI